MASFTDELYKLIECAASTGCHIIEEAVPLSCGHFICKECLDGSNYQIICKFCNEQNNLDNSGYSQSLCFEFFIETHLKEAFDLLIQNFKRSFEHFEHCKESYECRLKWAVKIIKIDLQRQVERIKRSMDKLNMHYNNYLDDFEKNALR